MFITDFNKRVYSIIKNIILSNRKPDISVISGYEFSIKEIGRITKIICSYNNNIMHEDSVFEYINILKQEQEKQKFKNINNISEFEIQDYIKKLKY